MIIALWTSVVVLSAALTLTVCLYLMRLWTAPRGGRLRVYIAGPYSASTPEGIEQNVATARAVMRMVIQRGHSPFCPHTMTHYEGADEFPQKVWYAIDLDWLPWCHCILMLPDWERSRGARLERQRAIRLGIRVIYSLDELRDNSRWWQDLA